MQRLLFLAVAVAMAVAVCAQRQSSRRGRLKASPVVSAQVGLENAPFDTVAATAGMVRFSGYEKTLRATRETVFVSNLSEREIDRVIFHITYRDAQGRQLHETRHCCRLCVPPGETRRLDFPTWDRQFAFYYARSPRPRVPAIPYTVEIRPDTLLLVAEGS